jgi:adenylate kinase
MNMPAPPWPALLLLGPTGAGKSPLGAEIEHRGLFGRRAVHLDFGALLRSIAAGPKVPFGLTAEEIAAVRSSLASGALFEDRDLPMIVRIVGGFVADRAFAAGDLLVLNGLPRHPRQAEGLAGLVRVESVIVLDAGADVIRERMRLDPDGDRSGRSDGSPEAVTRRLADYRSRTLPLADHFRRLGVPVRVIRVTAATTAGETYRRLVSALGGCVTDISG